MSSPQGSMLVQTPTWQSHLSDCCILVTCKDDRLLNSPQAHTILKQYFEDIGESEGGPVDAVNVIHKEGAPPDAFVRFTTQQAKSSVVRKIEHVIVLEEVPYFLDVLPCPRRLEEKYVRDRQTQSPEPKALKRPEPEVQKMDINERMDDSDSEDHDEHTLQPAENKWHLSQDSEPWEPQDSRPDPPWMLPDLQRQQQPPVSDPQSEWSFDNPMDSSKYPGKTVEIQGLPAAMTEEFLESFLEKEIGPIEHIKMLPGPVALVTFTQKEDSVRTLTYPLRIGHVTLSVSWYIGDEAPPGESDHTVELTGVEEHITEDVLEMILGVQIGEITSMTVDRQTNIALITLPNDLAVKQALMKGEVTIGDNTLYIRETVIRKSEEEEMEVTSYEDSCVQVTGLGRVHSKDVLEAYFSKQGQLDDITVDDETKTAKVTFKHSNDARELVDRGDFKYGGSMLSLSFHKMPRMTDYDELDEGSSGHKEERQVRVRGLTAIHTQDVLQPFMEKYGEIEDVDCNEFEAIVTFTRPQDAKMVVEMKNKDYGGATLLFSFVSSNDSLMKASNDPLDDSGDDFPSDPSPHMVVITGILELHTDDVLEAYFEKNYGPLEKVDVQLPDSKAMLTFKNRRDAEKLLKQTSVDYGGARLQISSAPSPSKTDDHSVEMRASRPPLVHQEFSSRSESTESPLRVEVRGISDIHTSDVIEAMFLKNNFYTKSVDVDEANGRAVVTFYDHATARQVASHRRISYGDSDLIFRLMTDYDVSPDLSPSTSSVSSRYATLPETPPPSARDARPKTKTVEERDKYGTSSSSTSDRYGAPSPSTTDRYSTPSPSTSDRYGAPLPSTSDRYGAPLPSTSDRYGTPSTSRAPSGNGGLSQQPVTDYNQRGRDTFYRDPNKSPGYGDQHAYAGTQMASTQAGGGVSHNPPSSSDGCCVEVTGLREQHSEDALEACFAKMNFPPHHIHVQNGRAVLLCMDEASARHIASYKEINYGGAFLTLKLMENSSTQQKSSPIFSDQGVFADRLTQSEEGRKYYQPSNNTSEAITTHNTNTHPQRSPAGNNTQTPQPHATTPTTDNNCTVEITGVDEQNCRYAQLFFELPDKSGGGPIVSFDYNGPETDTATIVFEDPKDAAAVLDRWKFSYKGFQWTARQPRPATIPKPDLSPSLPVGVDPQRAVLVKCAPTLEEDILPLFLKNKRRSGGGPLKSLVRVSETSFLAEFEKLEDAANLCEEGRGKCGDDVLMYEKLPQAGESQHPNLRQDQGMSTTHQDGGLSSPRQEERMSTELSGSAETSRPSSQSSQNSSLPPTSHTLLVKGVPADTPHDFIKLYFESSKLTGHFSEVQSCQKVEDGLLLSYKNPADAMAVAKQRLKFEKHSLSISMLDVPPTDQKTHAVKVTNIPQSLSESNLQLIMESARSGGGKTDDFFFVAMEGYAVITFADSTIAEKILRQGSIRYENMTLNVTPLDLPPLSRIVLGAVDKERLIVRGISSHCVQGDLNTFLSKHASCTVQSVLYTPEPGVALVRFSGIPDYEQLRDTLAQRPLKDSLLSIQKVKIPNAVQVNNVKQISKDMLTLYFENPGRSSGGTVKNLTKDKTDSCAVVEFEDQKVVRKVLMARHTLSDKQLETLYYYEDIGIIPPGHNTSVPSVNIPRGITITQINQAIVSFWLKSSGQQKKVDDLLSHCYAAVDWSNSSTSSVSVTCTLTTRTQSFQSLATTWEADVHKELKRFQGFYVWEKISVLQDVWKTFLQFTSKLLQTKQEGVMVDVNNKTCSVFVVGEKREAQPVVNKINKILKNATNQLEREKKSIIEKMPLQPLQVDYLKQIDFLENLEKQYRLDCTYGKDNVVIRGLPEPIKTAKVSVFEHLQTVNKIYISLPESVADMMLSPAGQTYVHSLLNTKNLRASFEKGQQGIVALASTHDADKIKSIVTTMFDHNSLSISNKEGQALNSGKWKDVHKDVEKKHNYLVKILTNKADNGFTVDVVSPPNSSASVQNTISEYLLQNVEIEQFLDMKLGVVKYIEKYMQKELVQLFQKIHCPDLKLTASFTADHSGYEFVGNGAVLKKVAAEVAQLTSRIHEQKKTVQTASVVQTLQTPKGRTLLDGVETSHRVTIEILTSNAKKKTDKSTKENKQIDDKPEIKCQTNLNNWVKLSVVQGNIVNFVVDVIVNAANKRLEHVGGLARAIVQQGGNSIEKECIDFIKRNSTMRDGDVFMSGPGQLKCRYIAHVVGPIWKGGNQNEDRYLACAIDNALEEAHKRRCSSIAIPAVSLGIYGYPKQRGTEVIIDAILGFIQDKGRTSLTDIQIVDQSAAVINTFQDALINKLGRHKVQTMKTNMKTLQREPEKHKWKESSGRGYRGSGDHSGGGRSGSGDGRSGGSGHGGYSAGSGSGGGYGDFVLKDQHTLQNNQGMTVRLRKGLIQKSSLDIIVNTTSPDLKLSNGAISLALSRAGGPQLQQDCDTQAPSGVKHGEIIETSPGRLPCKAVYHGALKNWRDKDAKQVMEKFIQNCLLIADAAGHTSMAIPPLGTGALSTPITTAVSILLDEISQFSKSNPSSSLSDITLVIYEKDLDKYEECKRLFSGSSGGGSGSSGRGSSWGGHGATAQPVYDMDEEDEWPRSEGGRSSQWQGQNARSTSQSWSSMEEDPPSMQYDADSVPSSPGADTPVIVKKKDELEVQLSGVILLVKKGDITKEQTDAILNITDNSFKLNSGAVEKAILRAGGQSILDELQTILSTQGRSEYIVTNAGNLQCQKIVHYGRGSSSTNWDDVVDESLKQAEQHSLQSMALPAIGTGTLGNSADMMVRLMMKGIQSFLSKRRSSNINLIHITVFQDDIHKEFCKTIAKDLSPQKKGAWSNFWSAVKAPFTSNDKPEAEDRSFEMVDAERGGSEQPYSSSRHSGHERKTPQEIVLCLFGVNQPDIDGAMRAIEDVCESELQDIVLNSENDQRLIRELSEKQIARVKSFQSSTIQIQITNNRHVATIRVRGNARDILQVVEDIRAILRKADEQAKSKEHAKQFSQLIQWVLRDAQSPGGHRPYPPELNMKIEKAYHDKVPFFDWKAGGMSFRINFNKNQQETPGTASPPIDVHRKVLLRLPPHWEKMQDSDAPKLVQLQQGSSEYQKVLTEFKKTVPNQTIKKIERVQNASLWSRYSEHKRFMQHGKRTNQDVEKYLWHGTSAGALENIYIKGLDRGYNGSHGTAYGKGAYFARDASYSVGYSAADGVGNRCMFQCRVLTGDYTVGSSAMKDVPIKDSTTNPATRYDSVVDNTANPSIYVIFSDTQAYPAYLVTF